jgi:hypothetical protein
MGLPWLAWIAQLSFLVNHPRPTVLDLRRIGAVYDHHEYFFDRNL